MLACSFYVERQWNESSFHTVHLWMQSHAIWICGSSFSRLPINTKTGLMGLWIQAASSPVTDGGGIAGPLENFPLLLYFSILISHVSDQMQVYILLAGPKISPETSHKAAGAWTRSESSCTFKFAGLNAHFDNNYFVNIKLWPLVAPNLPPSPSFKSVQCSLIKGFLIEALWFPVGPKFRSDSPAERKQIRVLVFDGLLLWMGPSLVFHFRFVRFVKWKWAFSYGI